jgi:hypothetical protein
MSDFVVISEIIPVSSDNERICFLKIRPKLMQLSSFRKFYDLQFKLLKKNCPHLLRLDFCYHIVKSPYV